MLDVKGLTSSFIEPWRTSSFADNDQAPWHLVGNIEALLRQQIAGLDSSYQRVDEIAVHRTAIIEAGAVVKGPAIIGPNCFIAAGAYLGGGVYLERDCIIGPSSELKTTAMFAGSKLAHLNFVGDSIIGADVNIEAGVIIANYRNELENRNIRIAYSGQVIDTGVDKFGALVGDRSRIGANAVVAPGALLERASIVGRLQLIDQNPQIELT
ncbi:DapH/DapD/GlmU-related protein [Sphingorhabdus sp. EL138]|uniref:DapH/DapD/GlmU-related protein n=1 Tax=Sphingorhabdus sp. EL138 TaxID=2073156 RepID=UPI0025DFB7DD|nr:DapH/DapD/GlmU-related protein [Sphingorhabdus sp. EL138]